MYSVMSIILMVNLLLSDFPAACFGNCYSVVESKKGVFAVISALPILTSFTDAQALTPTVNVRNSIH